MVVRGSFGKNSRYDSGSPYRAAPICNSPLLNDTGITTASMPNNQYPQEK
jgi:hypothetical protein